MRRTIAFLSLLIPIGGLAMRHYSC